MKCLIFNSYELADYFQKDLYQRGVLASKWPNDWENYNTVYLKKGSSYHFVPINTADFDLLTNQEMSELTDIDDSWYEKTLQ